MGPAAKWEYMKKIYERYIQADRKQKSKILDEFCATYDCDRKYAIRLIAKGPPPERRPARRRRGPTYSRRVVEVLLSIWEVAGHLWSERLKAALPLWMPAIRRHYHTTPEEERQLLRMSPSTIDRRLKDRKIQLRKRIYGKTKPGTWLKHVIQIRRGPWRVRRPGFTEMDLVSHSGNCAEGDFAQTLNMTDILTAWIERRCLPVKAQHYVRGAIIEIRNALPFDLLGLDVDSGGEFVNHMLYEYCRQDPKVTLTRSRPGKKNDNAHIEQKNNTHVRQWLGYFRYDTSRAVEAINDLFRNELRLFQNLFQPSVRLKKKVQVGSRTRRYYDKPRTPLDRLVACRKGDKDKVDALLELRKQLDPIVLSNRVDAKLKRIWRMASKSPRPSTHRPGRLPSYADKPLVGPPHIPHSFPPLQRYEQVWEREQRLQTN
jgi:hypothetical protein